MFCVLKTQMRLTEHVSSLRSSTILLGNGQKPFKFNRLDCKTRMFFPPCFTLFGELRPRVRVRSLTLPKASWSLPLRAFKSFSPREGHFWPRFDQVDRFGRWAVPTGSLGFGFGMGWVDVERSSLYCYWVGSLDFNFLDSPHILF